MKGNDHLLAGYLLPETELALVCLLRLVAQPGWDGKVIICYEHQARLVPLLRLLVFDLRIGEIAPFWAASPQMTHQPHEDVALGDFAPAEVCRCGVHGSEVLHPNDVEARQLPDRLRHGI